MTTDPERARRRDGSVSGRAMPIGYSNEVPDWGSRATRSSSRYVVAATGGALIAYDIATGKPRWFGPKGGWGYSSPQLATIDGVSQIVFVHGPGIIGVAPSDGTVLWNHEWGGDSIVQPSVLAGGDVLVGSGSGLAANSGVLRLGIARESGGWSAKQRWTSTGLKPYFNDFVGTRATPRRRRGIRVHRSRDGTRNGRAEYGSRELVVGQIRTCCSCCRKTDRWPVSAPRKSYRARAGAGARRYA